MSGNNNNLAAEIIAGKSETCRTIDLVPNNEIVNFIATVAPPSLSEQNERRAVRSRTRRERPRKLQLLDITSHEDDDTTGEMDEKLDTMFQPDVMSLVTSCIPGVSLSADMNPSTHTGEECSPPQRRIALIRKRSLPLMSFLSSTTLAAAEKKRKSEEQELQKAMAVEAAKKIVNSNPPSGKDMSQAAEEERFPTEITQAVNNAVVKGRNKGFPCFDQRETVDPSSQTTGGTVRLENTSNVLMPPLLALFLNSLHKLP